MRVDPRHREPVADIQDADIDLHLLESEPFHALVRAMIARAHKDSVGNTGVSSYMKLEKRQALIMDGLAFFRDGRCRHWCEHLGITDFELLNLDGR